MQCRACGAFMQAMGSLGRYEVLAELGRGAMGTVYRARDPKIDRVVAIKTIRVPGVSPEEDAEYRKRFFREAQAAGKLSHPGIVTIYDVGEEEPTQTPYIVMEYIAGRTLASMLAADPAGRPSLETSLDLVQQLAEALDYAHAQKIVHRDIKPTNIIVTADGRTKITDFGVAKLALTEFTTPGQFLGTPSYVSPEQLKGDAVDGRSDLFSLDVILYWMLTGEKPFTGDAAAVFYKILHQDPIPVSQCNPALRPEFDSVVSRGLAKDPAARYQRGRELAEDLEDLRQGRALRLRSGSVVEEPAAITPLQNPVETALLEKTMLLTAAGSISPTRQWAPLLSHFGRMVDHANRIRVAVSEHIPRFVGRLPVSGKAVIILGGLMVAGILFIFSFIFNSSGDAVFPLATPPNQSADLRINCYHSFRSADLALWVDNDLVYEGKLVGASQKGFRFFRSKAIGSLSKTVRVPAGKHALRVRVESPQEGYEQTRKIEAEITSDTTRTLEISFGKHNRALYLSWRD